MFSCTERLHEPILFLPKTKIYNAWFLQVYTLCKKSGWNFKKANDKKSLVINANNITMAQKKVSFEIAKALKEAGYPQVGRYQYTYTGKLVDLVREGGICYGPMAPSYIDAWLWLWRCKEIRICLEDAWDLQEPEIERGCYVGTNQLGGICSSQEYADPEDAIVDIIEYLVKNDLIK